MTEKKRVNAATFTHSTDEPKEYDSDTDLENHQKPQMLIDPPEVESTFTHSADEPKWEGDKKAPTTAKVAAARALAKKASKPAKAAITDPESTESGNLHGIPNDEDPNSGYLDEEDGADAIEVDVVADVNGGDGEFEEPESGQEPAPEAPILNGPAEIEPAMPPVGEPSGADEFVESEFGADDMEPISAPMEEQSADAMDAPAPEFGEPSPEQEPAPAFEMEQPSNEQVALVDVDNVPEQDEADMTFATIANVVHVIRSNRIIASMGPRSAAKIGATDVYLSTQFQDVVTASVARKGLRKGLVQSGFVLAKVKLTNSKATAKVVEAKVSAALSKKLSALAEKDKVMEQCLAIAAVGINRRYFTKEVNNELKANLETELQRAGVRGGSKLVSAMFSQYGVAYAKSILTLANRISTMPEAVRNQYAEALDLIADADFEPEAPAEEEDEGEAEAFEEIPASVSAALHSPIRKDVGVLLAGVKTNAAMSILNGSQSLI